MTVNSTNETLWKWDHTASWFLAARIHTNTPLNDANFAFIDPMVDSVYSKNVLRNYSVETTTIRKCWKSTTIVNANSILYGMDNYVNDVSQQIFHSTEECNIGNNIKIRISIGQQNTSRNFLRNNSNMQHEYDISHLNFCKPWQNDRTLPNSTHHGKQSIHRQKNTRKKWDRNQL